MNFLTFVLAPLLVVVMGQSNAVRAAPYLASRLPAQYQVINCALDGTSILEWQKGKPLYENCIAMVGGRKVAWIFFFQGERDSYIPEGAVDWQQNFYRMLSDFQNDIGASGTRVVYAQIGKLPLDKDRPYWRSIQVQQAHATEGHPNLRLLRTYIYPYCREPHFCPAGYDAIAKRAIYLATH